jgi:hypothetical protein
MGTRSAYAHFDDLGDDACDGEWCEYAQGGIMGVPFGSIDEEGDEEGEEEWEEEGDDEE